MAVSWNTDNDSYRDKGWCDQYGYDAHKRQMEEMRKGMFRSINPFGWMLLIILGWLMMMTAVIGALIFVGVEYGPDIWKAITD